MTKIGFIGLGVMGRPMATHLVEAGHEVVVHNRSRPKIDALVAAGARPGDGPVDVASQTDVVITMLPDSPDVAHVVGGEGGVLAGARPGAIWLDMSTIKPETTRTLGQAAAERDIRCLDAPVSGGEVGAKDASLSIMVGGSAPDFDEVRPILEVVGKTIVHVGPLGSGQIVKAANQMLVAGIIELVAEALVLIERGGVDPQPAVDVLAGGLAGNRILDLKARSMLAGSFEPGFRVDLHAKDLGIAMATAADAGVYTPVTALVSQQVAALQHLGRGGLDHSALMTLVEELSRPNGGAESIAHAIDRASVS
jgi:2-hydroxy-3-oxopropionate reductase